MVVWQSTSVESEHNVNGLQDDNRSQCIAHVILFGFERWANDLILVFPYRQSRWYGTRFS